MFNETQQRVDQTLQTLEGIRAFGLNRYAAVGTLHSFVVFLATSYLTPQQQEQVQKILEVYTECLKQ